MEKLKSMAKPDKFIVLKVIKSALEFIRLEGETESKSSLPKLLVKLDGKCPQSISPIPLHLGC